MADRCRECGAELSLGPTSCPLCGADVNERPRSAPPPKRLRVDDYQADVRKLREQLKRLRKGDAEAV